MATYQVLYWKNIPTQIKVYGNGASLSRQLTSRFQALVDRVAMAEGLTAADDYLNQLSWGHRIEHTGTPEDVMDEIVAELEGQFEQIVKRQSLGHSTNLDIITDLNQD